MSVREILNKNPRAAAVAAAAAALVLVILMVRTITSTAKSGQSFVRSAYYTTDDGKTYFADDLKPYPFDHDGKEAVRACVFRSGGQTFVGYLERYTEAGKAAVGPLLGSDDLAKQQKYVALRNTELQVKRPGDARWVDAGTQQGGAVTSIGPPKGNTEPPQPVFP